MSTPAETREARNSVLRARARELAKEADAPRRAGTTLEVMEFGLAGEAYALEAAFVSEVHRLENLTRLPCAPAFVLGLVNVRGRILPVIDLKKFFELPESGITDLHRILLLRSAGMEFGLLADTVAGVRSIPLDSIQASLPTLTGIRAEFLKGVTGDRLVILDAVRILEDKRIIVNEEVGI